jgi:hypothetical protein
MAPPLPKDPNVDLTETSAICPTSKPSMTSVGTLITLARMDTVLALVQRLERRVAQLEKSSFAAKAAARKGVNKGIVHVQFLFEPLLTHHLGTVVAVPGTKGKPQRAKDK